MIKPKLRDLLPSGEEFRDSVKPIGRGTVLGFLIGIIPGSAHIISTFVAYAIELLIIACAWVAASQTPDPDDGKYVLIYAAKHLLPTAMGCVFMITVVAIIVSTADSFLLVPATTFIKDVYLNYINPKAPEKRVIFWSRFLVVVFGLVAYGVSLMFAQSTGFFKKALYAYTIYGAAITPCLVAALFWKRATKQGAIASILAGTVTTLVWSWLGKDRLPTWAAQLDAVLPAITLSVIALVVGSLLTEPKPASATAYGLRSPASE